VFLLLSGVHLLGISFYSIFASSKRASWSEPAEENEQKRTQAQTENTKATAEEKMPETERKLDSIDSIVSSVCVIELPEERSGEARHVVNF
jgi:hypothetical protein